MRKAFVTFILLCLFGSLLAVSINQGTDYLNEVVLQSINTGEKLPVYIVLKEQYDSDTLYNSVKNLPKIDRRNNTVKTLKEFSSKSQNDLRIVLEQLENKGLVDKVRFLWISNIIGFDAEVDALIQIDNHPDIDYIEYDPATYALIGLDSRADDFDVSNPMTPENPGTREITYNVSIVNAPAVWEQGYIGEGAVVAVLDTGVNYNHLDIRERMWIHPDFPQYGYNFTNNSLNPMDDHSHGTHCAGTVAGDGTAGSETGMAPGATIMALKVLTSSGSGQHQWYWDAVQFAIEYGADIISVSLGWRNQTAAIRGTFRTIQNNYLAAGGVAAIAAGNESTSGLRTPGDTPPPWLHPDQTLIGGVSSVVTCGASDANDNIATFSSHGPTQWADVNPFNDYPLSGGNIGLLSPDIVAPGVNVKSLRHNSNDTYTTMSGTSMATPGVAGILALLLSRNPNLTPEDLCRIIEETAYTEPAHIPENKNNIWGSGRIDVLAAIEAVGNIVLQDYSFSDDNNDIPEYNEQIHISVSVLNDGIDPAENVTVTLSSEDEFVTIVEGVIVLGDMEDEETIIAENAFTVQTATNIPHLHSIEFNVLISAENELGWSFPLLMEVSAPAVELQNYAIEGVNHNVPEYGGEYNLTVTLNNEGGADALNVTGVLSSEDNYVTVLEDTALFAEIIVGQPVVNNETPFAFTIADNIPHLHEIEFVLSLYLGEHLMGVETFGIAVNAPLLELLPIHVYDTIEGGNGNGIIEPGENVVFYLPIKNTGGAVSPPVTFTVNSLTDYAEITTLNNSSYRSILTDESKFAEAYITVSANAVQGTVLAFEYSIVSGEYLFEGRFNQYVGGAMPLVIGSGIAVNNINEASPINIYYRSLRSQSVYTAEELYDAGAIPGMPIIQLGYYVVGTPAYPLRSFTLRLKHTIAVNASAHDDGPFETVYVDTSYTPVAGSWDMLNFSNDFIWNGEDNVLVDTAFNRVASWNSSGQLRINYVPDGFRFVRNDTHDTINDQTDTISNNRPQIRFIQSASPAINNPLGPQNLRVISYPDRNHLVWNALRDPEGYIVYRNGIRLNDELITETEYEDYDIEEDEEYFYYITASYDGAESLPSNIVQPEFLLEAPEILISLNYESNRVHISWEEVAGAVSYNVYAVYDLTENDWGEPIANIEDTYFIDIEEEAYRKFYRVTAIAE